MNKVLIWCLVFVLLSCSEENKNYDNISDIISLDVQNINMVVDLEADLYRDLLLCFLDSNLIEKAEFIQPYILSVRFYKEELKAELLQEFNYSFNDKHSLLLKQDGDGRMIFNQMNIANNELQDHHSIKSINFILKNKVVEYRNKMLLDLSKRLLVRGRALPLNVDNLSSRELLENELEQQQNPFIADYVYLYDFLSNLSEIHLSGTNYSESFIVSLYLNILNSLEVSNLKFMRILMRDLKI